MYCSVHTVQSLGGYLNTRRMSKPDMGSIFHINNQWNILVIENYYVNYQNDQNSMLLTSSDTRRTLSWCNYSCLQIPPRENWFQYERRVYATAIDFPYIITFGPLEDRSKSKIHMWRLGSYDFPSQTKTMKNVYCKIWWEASRIKWDATLFFHFLFIDTF